jgi:hypothetical protein
MPIFRIGSNRFGRFDLVPHSPWFSHQMSTPKQNIPPINPLSKPPSVPKASRNNDLHIHRQRLLKDRLKLKWGGDTTPSYLLSENDNQSLKDPVTGRPIHVKGFGEHQFNESSVFYEDDHRFDSTIEPSSSLMEESKNDIPFPKDNMKQKIYLTALSSQLENINEGGISSYHTIVDKNRSQSQHGMKEMKLPEMSVVRSHLQVSQSLMKDGGGYEEIVENLTQGKTDFCYLQPDKDNFYRFGLRNTFPSVATADYDDFTTISARGMLRFHQNDSELCSFADLAKEKTAYDKLLNLKLFRTYWEWKMFSSWKRYVVRKRMSKLVSNTSIDMCPFCRF